MQVLHFPGCYCRRTATVALLNGTMTASRLPGSDA